MKIFNNKIMPNDLTKHVLTTIKKDSKLFKSF